MKIISQFVIFITFLLVNTTINAQVLNLQTSTPALSASSATVDYLENAGDGDLSTLLTSIDFFDGISTNGTTELQFGIGFDLSTPTVGATGGFAIDDQSGTLLTGDVIQAVGFSTDTLEFQFTNLSGLGAASFNDSVLMTIAFDNSLGANPFDAITDGNAYGASISIANITAVSPIPEPEQSFMLVVGLVVLATTKRRKFL